MREQKEKKAGQKQNFLQGALILTVATLLVKAISALFKIFVMRTLSNSANTYFNQAYNIFVIVFSVATAGLPIAVSRMVSASASKGRFRDVRKIRKISSSLFLLLGIAGSLFLAVFAKPYLDLAGKNGNLNGALLAIWTFVPSILILCITSSYRGYYNGLQNMVPTAVSQVVEAVIKLIAGLALVLVVRQIGFREFSSTGSVFGVPLPADIKADAVNWWIEETMSPYTAAAAILGVTISSLVGMLYLMIFSRRSGEGITRQEWSQSPEASSQRQILRTLLAIAVPICLGALVSNLTSSIDDFTMQRRLAAAMAENPELMVEKYAVLFGGARVVADMSMADVLSSLGRQISSAYAYTMGIFLLVPTFATGFSTSALPAVTSAWVRGDRKDLRTNVNAVLRLTNLLAMPAFFLMILTPKSMLYFGYGMGEKAFANIQVAGPLLSMLAISVVLVSLASPINALLQAIGAVRYPVIFMAGGAVIKFLSNYFLIAIPEVALMGIPVGTLLCYLFIAIGGLWVFLKKSRVTIDVSGVFVKPMIAGLICGIGAFFVNGFLSTKINFRFAYLVALAVAVIIYIFFLILFGGISREDVFMLPKGEKFVEVLEKWRVLR